MAGTSNRDYTNEDLVGGQIRSKSDKRVNQRAQEYNRAAVTIAQRKKEQDLQSGVTANLMMQAQIAQEKAKLIDMAQKLDMQSRIIDNKLQMADYKQQQQQTQDALNSMQQIAAQQQPQQAQPIPFADGAIPSNMQFDFSGAQQQPQQVDPQVAGLIQGQQPVEEMPVDNGMPPQGADPSQQQRQPSPF